MPTLQHQAVNIVNMITIACFVQFTVELVIFQEHLCKGAFSLLKSDMYTNGGAFGAVRNSLFRRRYLFGVLPCVFIKAQI